MNQEIKSQPIMAPLAPRTRSRALVAVKLTRVEWGLVAATLDPETVDATLRRLVGDLKADIIEQALGPDRTQELVKLVEGS